MEALSAKINLKLHVVRQTSLRNHPRNKCAGLVWISTIAPYGTPKQNDEKQKQKPVPFRPLSASYSFFSNSFIFSCSAVLLFLCRHNPGAAVHGFLFLFDEAVLRRLGLSCFREGKKFKNALSTQTLALKALGWVLEATIFKTSRHTVHSLVITFASPAHNHSWNWQGFGHIELDRIAIYRYVECVCRPATVRQTLFIVI